MTQGHEVRHTHTHRVALSDTHTHRVALSHIGATVATVKDTHGLDKLKANGAKVFGILTPASAALATWSGWCALPVQVEEDRSADTRVEYF